MAQKGHSTHIAQKAHISRKAHIAQKAHGTHMAQKHIQEDLFNWAMGMGITKRPSDPPPLNFFRLLVGRWALLKFLLTDQHFREGGGVS